MFDSFKYKYLKVGDKAVGNRLYHVNDSINASIMTDDIDDEGTYSDASETINSWNNYGYDEIGNLQRDSTEGIKHIEWTAYGKIKSIVRRDGYFKTINGVIVYPSNLEFMYDAMGNRIAKIEKPRDANGQKSSADWKTTYYIRDAQGNLMATYKKSSETETASYKLIEHPIYGSSRVGIDNYTVEFVGYTVPSNGLTSRVLGLKQYELTNHLGNVLTTISDKKIPVENNGVVDHYVADITTVSDYYPFGSPMDGRTFSSPKYRFGFNGMEQDNEIQGSGNSYDFGARIYDSRLGRWMACDPLAGKYPDLSSYCFVANSPLIFVDPDGKRIILSFTSEKAKQAFLNVVRMGLENQYEVQLLKLESGNYELIIGTTETKKGNSNAMTENGRNFFLYMNEMIWADEVIKADIVYGRADVIIGRIDDGRIDIADIMQFNPTGPFDYVINEKRYTGLFMPKGATIIGKLGHELWEQYQKKKESEDPHQSASGVEDDINGNRTEKETSNCMTQTYTTITIDAGVRTETRYSTSQSDDNSILKVSQPRSELSNLKITSAK